MNNTDQEIIPDLVLIMQIRNGDFDALKHFNCRYRHNALKLAREFCDKNSGSGISLEDFMQSAMTSTYKALQTFSPEDQDFFHTYWRTTVIRDFFLLIKENSYKKDGSLFQTPIENLDAFSPAIKKQPATSRSLNYIFKDGGLNADLEMFIRRKIEETNDIAYITALKSYDGLGIKELSQFFKISQATVKKRLKTVMEEFKIIISRNG